MNTLYSPEKMQFHHKLSLPNDQYQSRRMPVQNG